MFSPKQIAEEVEALLPELTIHDAMREIARNHDIRFEDVKVVCTVYFEKLWKLWDPREQRTERNPRKGR